MGLRGNWEGYCFGELSWLESSAQNRPGKAFPHQFMYVYFQVGQSRISRVSHEPWTPGLQVTPPSHCLQTLILIILLKTWESSDEEHYRINLYVLGVIQKV